MVFGLILLAVLAVLLVLPLALWVALYRTRTRLMLLEQAVGEQKDVLGRLTAQVTQLKTAAGARPQAPEVASAPAVGDEAARPAPATRPAPVPAAAPPRAVPPPPVVAPPPPLQSRQHHQSRRRPRSPLRQRCRRRAAGFDASTAGFAGHAAGSRRAAPAGRCSCAEARTIPPAVTPPAVAPTPAGRGGCSQHRELAPPRSGRRFPHACLRACRLRLRQNHRLRRSTGKVSSA